MGVSIYLRRLTWDEERGQGLMCVGLLCVLLGALRGLRKQDVEVSGVRIVGV